MHGEPTARRYVLAPSQVPDSEVHPPLEVWLSQLTGTVPYGEPGQCGETILLHTTELLNHLDVTLA